MRYVLLILAGGPAAMLLPLLVARHLVERHAHAHHAAARRAAAEHQTAEYQSAAARIVASAKDLTR